MIILGVETSCDETAIAVAEAKDGSFKILSNVVSSQVKIHRRWGGVVPNLAKREHQKNLTPVLRRALGEANILFKIPVFAKASADAKALADKSAGKQNPKSKIQNESKALDLKLKTVQKILEREQQLVSKLQNFLTKYRTPDIDLIAIVNGPGLEPALWVGVSFAKALAFWWEKPLIPVNHLEAHLLTNVLANEFQVSGFGFQESFPAICLLVSGGHTMLVLMRGIGKYKIIGETRDDSAGECFDKTARILGLGYPGGPAIAKAANQALPRYKMQIRLPRPMINSKDYDFSFSGLKTAVLYQYQSQMPRVRKQKNYVTAMAAEIQQAIIDVLIAKTLRAAKEYKVKTVMIGGGVAANPELRRQLKEKLEGGLPGVRYIAPDVNLCTDNGTMAAVAGYFSWQRSKKGKTAGESLWSIKANSNTKL